jgi:hypothetical protein
MAEISSPRHAFLSPFPSPLELPWPPKIAGQTAHRDPNTVSSSVVPWLSSPSFIPPLPSIGSNQHRAAVLKIVYHLVWSCRVPATKCGDYLGRPPASRSTATTSNQIDFRVGANVFKPAWRPVIIPQRLLCASWSYRRPPCLRSSRYL